MVPEGYMSDAAAIAAAMQCALILGCTPPVQGMI